MKTLPWLGLFVVACGSSPAPAPSQATAAVASGRPGVDVPIGRTVRVIRLSPDSVESSVKSDPATAKKWGADPANALKVLPTFRHILVKAPAGNADARAAAKKKAEDLIVRLDRGEDFATLAKSSDDPGSARKGGAYPGSMVKMFVAEMVTAYGALRPGERAKAPVESQFGWHVVAKGPIDDEACIDGHRAWLAQDMLERRGRELAKGLRHVEPGSMRALVDNSVVVRMNAETCDGFATVARGEGISWREGKLVVAALTNDERDDGEVEAEGCEHPGDRELAEQVERLRRIVAESTPDTTGWVATPTPKARPFSVLRLEDGVNAASVVRDGTPGVEVRFEHVGDRPVHFVHFPMEAKEKESDVLARARTFVTTMKHPPQTSFVIMSTARENGTVYGSRTFLARDEVVIDERDVAKATPVVHEDEQFVAVELRPEGTKKLEALTREMLNRRIAILVDGVVAAAPIVQGVISTGRLELFMTGGTPAARRANADRVVKVLTKR